jgi:hypothetical protein
MAAAMEELAACTNSLTDSSQGLEALIARFNV